MTPTPSATLRVLADRYWEARLEASPLFATFLGDHRYDDRVDDLSAAGEAAQRTTWAILLDEAVALDTSGFDGADVVTHELLVGELRESIESIDTGLGAMGWDQMDGVHADLLVTAGQLRAEEPVHAAAAVVRLGRMGTMLEQAAERFAEAIAAGRTPPRVVIERSLRQVDGYLASPIEEDPFATMAGPADWDGEDAWRRAMTEVVTTSLRPAFAHYRTVLAEQLLPVARPDVKAGLCWLPGGDDLYRTLIRLHTGLDLDPEDLHEIGRHEATEVLPVQYREIGQRQFGTGDLAAIFGHMLDDADLRYADGDEILAHATDCLERAEAAMGEWFGIVPEAPCVLTPIPDYLAADAPAAYYTPPAPDGSRPGEYHVNLHDPTAKSRAETASIAYHEAIPGHHLQLAIAAERSELPAFRRLSWGHTAYVEGWALYTERLADEMGLYVTDIDRLGMLAGDSWRSCRLVVDTGLHAMGWSRQQAIDFMTAHAPVAPDEIATEIDRYIAIPGQALAYKVGQREIVRLRADAERRLGARFSLPAFHDVVLGAATVSLGVLAAQVEAWPGVDPAA